MDENENENNDNNGDGHGSSCSNIIKTSSLEELEVKFAKMTHRIKKALIKNKTNVGSLIEQLCTISTVRDKKVPLFDENVFKKVKTVEDLWRKLRSYWSIYDYDILVYVLKLAKCKKAIDIYTKFWSKIDSDILKDIKFILSCKEYKGEGLDKYLRVKLNVETITDEIKEQAEKAISKLYNLTEYALTFKGIKYGCIELIYGISKELESYLLHYKVSGCDLNGCSSCDILYLQICDKKLIIPSKITDMVCKLINIKFYLYTNVLCNYVNM